jgi:hypothetical protein
MSVGGKIVSNELFWLPIEGKHPKAVRKLWCIDRHGDETAVFADPSAESLNIGEEIWWQSGKIYARNDTQTFHKIGYSFDPTSVPA